MPLAWMPLPEGGRGLSTGHLPEIRHPWRFFQKCRDRGGCPFLPGPGHSIPTGGANHPALGNRLPEGGADLPSKNRTSNKHR